MSLLITRTPHVLSGYVPPIFLSQRLCPILGLQFPVWAFFAMRLGLIVLYIEETTIVWT